MECQQTSGQHPFLLTGGCHCRSLRYALTEPPLGTYACHCTDCQLLTSGAVGIGVVVAATAFELAGSPRLVRRVLGSGTISYRCICPECGVWVCSGSKLDATAPDEKRVIRGGTFDDTSWINPSAHYWTRSAQKWVSFPPGVAIYATQP